MWAPNLQGLGSQSVENGSSEAQNIVLAVGQFGGDQFSFKLGFVPIGETAAYTGCALVIDERRLLVIDSSNAIKSGVNLDRDVTAFDF